MTKLTNYEKHFKEKMKDAKFKKAYENERHRLEVAYKISRLRVEKSLSQKGLAERLGTTQSVVARMEMGEQNLTTDTLQKIAIAMNRKLKIEFTK